MAQTTLSKRFSQKISDTWSLLRDGASDLLEKTNLGGESEIPMRRKGETGLTMGIINLSGDTGDKKKQRDTKRQLNLKQLKDLADNDPIIWAIRKARRDQISQCEWTIVRDIENKESALDHWYDTICEGLNPWGMPAFTEYIPTVFDNKFITEVKERLGEILKSSEEGIIQKKAKLRWLFEKAKNRLQYETDETIQDVDYLFDKPCEDYPTWNQFMSRVYDDLLVYDSAVIIKNWNQKGDKLSELYTRPGDEIFIWRNEDSSVPELPETAFSWEKSATKLAEYDRDEVIHLIANPQHDYYGFGAVEAAAYVITATLMADDMNYTLFKYSNMPPGVFDLGENISNTQRVRFQALWDAEVKQRGGYHKILFINGSKGANYIPIRPYTQKDMQMLEYLKWSLSIKAACFQISPQDIGFTMDLHRSTSEVQYEISKDRGLKTALRLIQAAMTRQIIQKDFKRKDLKFQYSEDMKGDNDRQANLDQIDLNIGIISRNIRRANRGLPPKEGGDVIMVESPYGQVPIEAMDDIAELALSQIENKLVQTQLGETVDEGSEQEGLPGQEGTQEGKQGGAKNQGQTGGSTKIEIPKNKDINLKVNAKSDEKTVKAAIDSLKEQGIGDNIIKIEFSENEFGKEEFIDNLKKQYDEYRYHSEFRPEPGQNYLEYGIKRGLLENIAGEIDPEIMRNISSNNPRLAQASVASVLGAAVLIGLPQKAVKKLLKEASNFIKRYGSPAAKLFTTKWIRRNTTYIM